MRPALSRPGGSEVIVVVVFEIGGVGDVDELWGGVTEVGRRLGALRMVEYKRG